jgi:hypothetical protein
MNKSETYNSGQSFASSKQLTHPQMQHFNSSSYIIIFYMFFFQLQNVFVTFECHRVTRFCFCNITSTYCVVIERYGNSVRSLKKFFAPKCFKARSWHMHSNSKPFGQGQNSIGRRRNALERTTAKINEPFCGNNM